MAASVTQATRPTTPKYRLATTTLFAFLLCTCPNFGIFRLLFFLGTYSGVAVSAEDFALATSSTFKNSVSILGAVQTPSPNSKR